MLNQAIIAENSGVIDLDQAHLSISTSSASVKGMFSLSPTKFLLVFNCKEDTVNVVSMDSQLWNVFDDVRMWYEGEMFDNRLVRIECFGIHPKCWSKENVKSIGEKWGPALCVNNRVGNVCSLTYARMLVRTKAQNRIDTRIKLLFDHGSCDVWVKESCGLSGSYRHSRKQEPMNLRAGSVFGGGADTPRTDVDKPKETSNKNGKQPFTYP